MIIFAVNFYLYDIKLACEETPDKTIQKRHQVKLLGYNVMDLNKLMTPNRRLGNIYCGKEKQPC